MPPSGLLEVIEMIEQRRVPMAEADVALVAAGAAAIKFLELLAGRGWERLIASLASDAHARFLLPHGLEEYDGRDAIVARIRSWFGSASVFDLAASSEDVVGMRHRISWRSSSAIPPPRRTCLPWQGCSGSGSRPPRRTTTGASPSLWRDRNEREADLQLHLGPGRAGAGNAALHC